MSAGCEISCIGAFRLDIHLPNRISRSIPVQVAKWGNSLAIRIPAAVVEALDLKPGDEVEIKVADRRESDVARKLDAPGSPGRACVPCAACYPPISCSTGTRRMPGNFFDTNVLIYVGFRRRRQSGGSLIIAPGRRYDQRPGAERDRQRATTEIASLVVGTHDFLTFVRTCLVVRPVTVATHDAGLEIAERYGLAIYDSMIVAAALEADCDTLWSEDMHHGLVHRRPASRGQSVPATRLTPPRSD